LVEVILLVLVFGVALGVAGPLLFSLHKRVRAHDERLDRQSGEMGNLRHSIDHVANLGGTNRNESEKRLSALADETRNAMARLREDAQHWDSRQSENVSAVNAHVRGLHERLVKIETRRRR
jgi:hypothetical protein